MSSPRWLQSLPSLWLEFWLPLPILGVLFWCGGNWVTNQVLSRPYTTVSKLQADTQTEVKVNFPVTVLLIKAEIYKPQGLTKVAVKTAQPTLKKLEFEFPVTEFNQLEVMIAQELGLSRECVRKLVRYQVKN